MAGTLDLQSLFSSGGVGINDNFKTGQQPIPVVTPYPQRGANPNVPVGQTGLPYAQDFIGPIYNQSAPVGTPLSQVKTAVPTNPNPKPTGQVLGDNTGGGTKSIEEQQRDAYFAELDRQAGLLPEQQRSMESQINSLFGSQSNSINTALTNSLGSLDLSKQNINSGQADSLRGLDESMRNQLTAGNKMLGSYGAGDSTAVNQLKYALGRTGSQNRTAIMKQGQQLLAQVDQQINTAKSTAQDQLQQLETWKNTQLAQISQYIASLKGQIDSSRANYIQQNLANLDAQVQNYKNNIIQWISNKATSLDQYKQMIQQAGVGPDAIFPSNQVAGLNTPAMSTEPMLFGSLSNKKELGLT